MDIECLNCKPEGENIIFKGVGNEDGFFSLKTEQKL